MTIYLEALLELYLAEVGNPGRVIACLTSFSFSFRKAFKMASYKFLFETKRQRHYLLMKFTNDNGTVGFEGSETLIN